MGILVSLLISLSAGAILELLKNLPGIDKGITNDDLLKIIENLSNTSDQNTDEFKELFEKLKEKLETHKNEIDYQTIKINDIFMEVLKSRSDVKQALKKLDACPDENDILDTLLMDIGDVKKPDIFTPITLIKADYKIVDFMFRDDEQKKTKEWCFDTEGDFKIRLYIGSGGVGKTRLFMKMCEIVNEKEDWRAGFLNKECNEFLKENRDFVGKINHNIFLVIDYAEQHTDNLDELLKCLVKYYNEKIKLRIVLIARGKHDWWDELKSRFHIVNFSSENPIELETVAETTEKKKEFFVNAFENICKETENNREIPDLKNFDNAVFENTLHIILYAYAATEGKEINDYQELLKEIILREKIRIKDIIKDQELKLDLDMVLEAIAMITLAGGVKNKNEALEVIKGAPLLENASDIEKKNIVKLLRDIYPGRNYISALQPDAVGQKLVSMVSEDE